MRNVTRPAASRKPRSKPVRTIKLDPAPFEGAPRPLTITVDGKAGHYWLKAVPSDFGLAFQLDRFPSEVRDEDTATYHVILDPIEQRNECSCRGFLHHRHCKHVASLEALRLAKQL
jgi:hypothetical protein